MSRHGSSRHGGAPPPTFPRWGYLDKYAVNEYMARALLATLGLSGLFVAGTLLPHPPHVVTRVVLPEPASIGVTPLPLSIIEPVQPRTQPQGGPKPELDGAVRPVPNDQALTTTFTPGNGGSPDGTTDGVSSAREVGDTAVPDPAPPELPDFDAYVAVEKQPVLLSIPEPTYPDIAREARIEGEVLVRALVGSDGFVRDAVVIQSVLGLDEAALAAALKAVFEPALQQDRAVAVWVVIPISFQLHG